MGEFSSPFFWAPFFFLFFLIPQIFNQALILLHYYKNSPPISKSWIRACIYRILLSSSQLSSFSPIKRSGIVTGPHINIQGRIYISQEANVLIKTLNKGSCFKHLLHSSDGQLAVSSFFKWFVILCEESPTSMAWYHHCLLELQFLEKKGF